MNEQIKQFKEDLLNKLKAQKEAILRQGEALTQQRFAQKQVAVNEMCAKLDNAYAQYKQEKFAVYNADITKKSDEVTAKKNALILEAKETAKAEIQGELAVKTAEYDNEIAKLEKELA